MSESHLTNGHGVYDPDKPGNPLDGTMAYAGYISKSLRQRVEHFRRAGVSLLDELAVVKCIAGDALRTYERSLQAADKLNLTESQHMSIQASAAAYLTTALNQVKDMAVAAHRVLNNETLDPQVVQAIIFQTVKAIDNTFEREAPRLIAAGIDPRELCDRLASDIDEVVGAGIVPEKLGVSMTPESLAEEVQAMHRSVMG